MASPRTKFSRVGRSGYFASLRCRLPAGRLQDLFAALTGAPEQSSLQHQVKLTRWDRCSENLLPGLVLTRRCIGFI